MSRGLVRRIVLPAIAAACAAGLWPLYTQFLTVGMEAAARRVMRGGDLGPLRGWERLCLGRCPVSGLVAAGSARAAAATRVSGGRRVDLLREAQGQLRAATAIEPLNGAAWIQQAYVQQLLDLGPSPRLQGLLGRSYEVQPFSAEGGLWRVRLCGGYWPLLARPLRRAAIAEARWRWSIHPEERRAILAALPSPDARAALSASISALPLRPY